jgi:hypothetical protein
MQKRLFSDTFIRIQIVLYKEVRYSTDRKKVSLEKKVRNFLRLH